MNYTVFQFIALLCFSAFTKDQKKGDIVFKRGTTILTLVSPDTIWMAADSKISNLTGKNSMPESSSSGRKIYKTNNIAYGFAALLSADNKSGRTIFESHRIMENILKKEGNILKAFEEYNDSIIIRLNQILDTMRLNGYADIINKYTKEPIHSFVMASFQSGKPNCLTRSYIIKKTENNYRVQETISETYDYGIMFFMMGSNKNIKLFLTQNQEYFLGLKRVKDRLVCLISLEAARMVSDVGMPVNAITLDRKSFTWSLDNRECKISD